MTATSIADSPTIAPRIASTPTPTPTPVEYVRSLDADDKHAVLMELLREAVELNGDNGLLLIEDEAGQSYGYFVSPRVAAAQFERAIPNLTEAERERSRRALENLDDTFEIEDFLNSRALADAKPS